MTISPPSVDASTGSLPIEVTDNALVTLPTQGVGAVALRLRVPAAEASKPGQALAFTTALRTAGAAEGAAALYPTYQSSILVSDFLYR